MPRWKTLAWSAGTAIVAVGLVNMLDDTNPIKRFVRGNLAF